MFYFCSLLHKFHYKLISLLCLDKQSYQSPQLIDVLTSSSAISQTKKKHPDIGKSQVSGHFLINKRLKYSKDITS